MEGVELKEEWQDEDFPRYSQSSHNVVKPFMDHGSKLCITCLCFESDMDNNPTKVLITSCLNIRPLPEEEELEDELFAGTSEEADPGRENSLVYCASEKNLNVSINCSLKQYNH